VSPIFIFPILVSGFSVLSAQCVAVAEARFVAIFFFFFFFFFFILVIFEPGNAARGPKTRKRKTTKP
jgi:hypothetical protein